MPGVASPTVRVSHVGHLANGEEFNWSFWLACSIFDVPTQAEFDALIAAVEAIGFAQFYNPVIANGPCSLMSADSGIDQMRGYYYPPNATVAELVSERAFVRVGNGAVTNPNQCSAVMSLRSGVPSRRGRGRAYLPANGATLFNHQLSPDAVNAVSLAGKAYLDQVNLIDFLGGSVTAVVRSVAASATYPIQTLVMDSRTDVQRRRANSETVLAAATRAIVV